MTLAGRTLVLTGASGFLGGRVASELARRGARLRLLLRRPAAAPPIPGAEVVALDLGAPAAAAALPGTLASADGFVHVAAVVKTWLRDRSEFDRVNVGALRQILGACGAASVPLVHVSSFVALGPTDGRVATEESPRGDDLARNDYERTKTAADVLARQAQAEGRAVTILYPGVIYGPGEVTDGNLVVKTVRDLARGRVPGLLGGGASRWSYAYVDDVVAGIAACVEAGRTGERYLLGGENASVKELLDAAADLLSRPRLSRTIPWGVARAVGAAEVALAHLTGRTPQLTPGVVEIFRHDWALDSGKAVRDLGYRITPLAEGLRATVAWMREQRLL